MKKALLVIDMQEVTVGENHADFFDYDSRLLDRVNAVIEKADSDSVVYIKNLMKDNLINKLAPIKVFDGTPQAELAEELMIVSQNVFSKYTGDAFSVPELCDFIKSRGFDTVELIGVDGGGCVALTALGACKLGYKVIIVQSAVGTKFTSKKEKYFEKLKKLGAQFV